MTDNRFYIDHGVIHDRDTGKHVVTDGKPPFEDSVEQVLDLLNGLQRSSERIDATRAALRTALGQWRMYAEMYETGGGIERDFDIEKEKSPEADMYRRCKAALSVDVVSGATEGGNG